MIFYHKILGMVHEGLGLQTVSVSTGYGRKEVTKILQLTKKGVYQLELQKRKTSLKNHYLNNH